MKPNGDESAEVWADPVVRETVGAFARMVDRAREPEPAPVITEGAVVWHFVVNAVKARVEMGVQKYGTPLQAGNGRDALMDAFQEAIDLVMYLGQVILERERVIRGPDGQVVSFGNADR